MFKRTKVVMLPTNEKAHTQLICRENHLMLQNKKSFKNDRKSHTTKYYNLYITSDDEIKKSDWFIANQGVHQCLEVVKGDYPYKVSNQYNKGEIQYQSKHWLGKKIIATTDSSLQLDYQIASPKERAYFSLPKPSQAFIEKYIEEYNKGNVITDVLVEYENCYVGAIYDDEGFYDKKYEDILKVNSKDNTITIKKVKDSWNREEVKNIIKSIVKEISYGNEELLHHYDGDFKELNKWIKKNI